MQQKNESVATLRLETSVSWRHGYLPLRRHTSPLGKEARNV